MTPQRLSELLEILGWSERQLARLLECGYATVDRWVKGKQSVAPKVADWLEHRASTATPPPQDWQRKRGPKPGGQSTNTTASDNEKGERKRASKWSALSAGAVQADGPKAK